LDIAELVISAGEAVQELGIQQSSGQIDAKFPSAGAVRDVDVLGDFVLLLQAIPQRRDLRADVGGAGGIA
jgi:hypothetical protein